MRALKINFGGAQSVSIDWNGEVKDLACLAQRAGVSILTQAGSDKFLPDRGTDVTRTLLSYGVFDLLGMQHLLNFGALQARSDMQRYEDPSRNAKDRISNVQMALLNVKDNSAQVGIVVTNDAGESTKEITNIS